MARSRGRGRHGFRGRPGRPSIGPFPRAGPAPGRPRRGGRNPWPVTAGGRGRHRSGGRGSPVRGARSRTAPGTWMGVEKTDGGGPGEPGARRPVPDGARDVGGMEKTVGGMEKTEGRVRVAGKLAPRSRVYEAPLGAGDAAARSRGKLALRSRVRGLVCTRRRLAPETLPPGLAGSWRRGLVCAVSCPGRRSRAREGSLVPGKAGATSPPCASVPCARSRGLHPQVRPHYHRLGPVCTRRSQRRCQKTIKQIKLRE